eukprot:ctg_1348.g493
MTRRTAAANSVGSHSDERLEEQEAVEEEEMVLAGTPAATPRVVEGVGRAPGAAGRRAVDAVGRGGALEAYVDEGWSTLLRLGFEPYQRALVQEAERLIRDGPTAEAEASGKAPASSAGTGLTGVLRRRSRRWWWWWWGGGGGRRRNRCLVGDHRAGVAAAAGRVHPRHLGAAVSGGGAYVHAAGTGRPQDGTVRARATAAGGVLHGERVAGHTPADGAHRGRDVVGRYGGGRRHLAAVADVGGVVERLSAAAGVGAAHVLLPGPLPHRAGQGPAQAAAGWTRCVLGGGAESDQAADPIGCAESGGA